MQKSKKLRIGIIGSGFGQYGVFPALYSHPKCEVVAVCGAKRKQFVEYYASIGFTNIYGDWKKMLKEEKLDAVAIAVTPRAQQEIAKFALQKGLHVFAEKPLALGLREAKTLLKMAEKRRVTHGVDFIFPEIAAWKKAKEILEKKTLGRLLHIDVIWEFLSYDIAHKKRTWKTDVKEGGGALSFFFSHGLHYMEHFGGTIDDVESTLTYSKESLGGADVGVDLQVQFAKGVTGTAHVRCNAPGTAVHKLVFICEKGTMVLENKDKVVDGFTLTTNTMRGKKVWRVKEASDRKGEGERVKIVRKLTSRFVECALKNKQMYPSFREGVRVQELIDRIRN